ncbi:hypothetical protein [Demetria terragena]|uniref:hypothetical protein n=1 Tax=Demetria terragena TaxID=63959 RepID=UPI000362BBAB|nr:hypothetical protein [Demetria terragena]
MKIRALAAACALTLVSVSAASAGPGPEAPEVKPQTAAGSGEKIEPGQYRFSVPADTDARYLRLSRALGESVVLTGYAISGPKVGDALTFDLMLPDGETSCDSDSATASNPGDGLSPAVVLEGKESERVDYPPTNASCGTAEDLLLQISRGSDDETTASEPLKVELTYSREPKAEGDLGPAVKESDLKARPLPVKDDKDVAAGTTPHTAAPLSGDTGTKVEVVPGARAFYKVHVGWGQRLDVAAQVPANGTGYQPPVDLNVDLDIVSPQGVSVGLGEKTTAYVSSTSESDPKQLSAFTAPVRWANRDAAITDTALENAVWTTQPGWYVVSLRVAPSSVADGKLPENPKPMPTLLTVRTEGQATAGPSFTSDGQQVGAPPVGQISGEGQNSGSVLGLVLKVGVTLIVLAGLGVVVVWFRRGQA